MRTTHLSLAAALLLAVTSVAIADEARTDEAAPGAIAWQGTWEGGLAEAKRTKRPILLISAAPHCKNISGIW